MNTDQHLTELGDGAQLLATLLRIAHDKGFVSIGEMLAADGQHPFQRLLDDTAQHD